MTWIWPTRSIRGSLQRRASFPEAKDSLMREGIEASHLLPAWTGLRFRPKHRSIPAPPNQLWGRTPGLPATGHRPVPGCSCHWSQSFLTEFSLINPSRSFTLFYVTVVKCILAIIFWIHGLFLYLSSSLPSGASFHVVRRLEGEKKGEREIHKAKRV